jgi:hypothetical protein
MRQNEYPSDSILEGDNIRLIKLLPGEWNDKIQCQLIYNSLSNVPRYHALSYVWGPRHKMSCIHLEARPFYITINLEYALRHLRHQLRDTLLWIDALSINQTDNRERTNQVNLMGSIYRSSQSVLVYLGDSIPRCRRKARSLSQQKAPPILNFSTEESHPRNIESSPQRVFDLVENRDAEYSENREMQNIVSAFTLIQELSQGNHLGDILHLGAQSTDNSRQESFTRVFESLRQLMHAPFTPWWTRIWVVQEVILPPKVTVVHGTISAPWSLFAQAASRCSHHIHHCCTKHTEELPRDIVNVLKDFCERVLDIETMRSACRGDSTEPINLGRLDFDVVHENVEKSSLITLLRRFRNRKATDPRDKVYALLSLVEPSVGRRSLRPDYSLSDAEVYIRATMECIYASRSLSVLSVDAARKHRQDLPSWVPDWEAPGDFGHNERIDTMALYNACSEFPVDSSTVRLEGGTLVMHGKLIGCVDHVGKVMLSESTNTFRAILNTWIEDMSNGVSRGGLHLDWWRILCADVVYDLKDGISGFPRRAQESDEFLFVTWAKLSRKSPFRGRHRDLDGLLSYKADCWSQKLEFELLVDENLDNTENIARLWEEIHSNKEERVKYLVEVMGSDEMTTGKDDRVAKSKLIYHATASIGDISDSARAEYLKRLRKANPQRAAGDEVLFLDFRKQARQLQIQAWRKVPWRELYTALEPDLMLRIGALPEQLRLSYDAQVSIMDRSIVTATKARCLYTSGEYIGLGPTNLAQGDELYIIQGGNTPFIFRRYSSHRIIGDCFAFGLMDSDDVALACSKRQKQLQDIVESYRDNISDLPANIHDELLRCGRWHAVNVF